MKKYEFTGETREYCGVTLKRIRKISNGEIGGWIQKEANLSHDGNAWVYGNARVYGDATVRGNAWVYGDARVRGFDEILSTNQYMVIQGFTYTITVTYSSIHIGCKSYTFDELDHEHNDLPCEEVALIKPMIELALENIMRKI